MRHVIFLTCAMTGLLWLGGPAASEDDAKQKMREAAARIVSANNLKQLGLAMHGYHDKHGSLPAAATYDKGGKALLSWRVAILPFVEQKALYDEFKQDEAWDSAHNKKLLAKMPKPFADPTNKGKAGHTFYQVVVGKGAAFEGRKGVKLTDFTDGTSTTILIAEGNVDVAWTKPVDLDYQAGKRLPAFGGIFPNGFNTLFADGSVRFVARTVKGKTLEAAITRNGGEVIGKDD
jgi:prepilin-type processing-associated H-X9-DG protein